MLKLIAALLCMGLILIWTKTAMAGVPRGPGDPRGFGFSGGGGGGGGYGLGAGLIWRGKWGANPGNQIARVGGPPNSNVDERDNKEPGSFNP